MCSHPAAPWSGTLRKSRLVCWGACLLPLSLSWLTLVGKNGWAVFPDVGLWLLWCCEFLWLAAWFAFFSPPFWWATPEEHTSLRTFEQIHIDWGNEKIRKVNVPGGPGATRVGVWWCVLDMSGRLWVTPCLVGPEWLNLAVWDLAWIMYDIELNNIKLYCE